MSNRPRHVLGLSGGKDSAALAVYLHLIKKLPDIEYFFCDTKKELQETYDYLDRLKARLGIRITYLSTERGFDHWLKVYGGLLPSAKMRWCTKQLKIVPLEEFIGDDLAITYIGIRADELRDGYISTKPTISPRYPFKEDGLVKADIVRLLEESGIGVPDYYRWRSRSGCFFCFFQRKIEWVRLADEHPDLFAQAVAYEQSHSDGRHFSWVPGETLLELVARRSDIVAEHERQEARARGRPRPNASLAEVLSATLDEEDSDDAGCVICHV